MDMRTLVLGIAIALVLSGELVLWLLFRRRVRGFIFPREIDVSPFRFFTMMRLRICALLHTAFLLLATIGVFLFTW